MRRLIFSLICSSTKAANVPKPTSVCITSSQSGLSLASRGRRNAQLLPFANVPLEGIAISFYVIPPPLRASWPVHPRASF
jgi:hypothetical protein